jgi:hypothetical protein
MSPMPSASVLAGRWEEITLLARAWHEAVAGQPLLVSFEGDPGVGKSALLHFFAAARRREEEAPAVVLLEPPPEGAYDPVEMAALLITHKRLYDRFGGRRRASVSGRRVVLDLITVVPGVGTIIAALAATGDALRRRRRRRIRSVSPDEDVESLLDLAARHPLAVLVDDAHRLSPGAAGRLEMLIRSAAPGTRLLVTVAHRAPPPGAAQPPIHDVLRLLPAPLQRRRLVGALSEGEVRSWLEKRFPGIDPPPEFDRWLHESSGGHAATLQAILDHLLASRTIRFRDRHWQLDTDSRLWVLPPRAGFSFDAGAIPPESVAVLRAASALEEVFDSGTLGRTLCCEELVVEDRLAIAVRHGLIAHAGERQLQDGDIVSLYRFASPHVRAALRGPELAAGGARAVAGPSVT